MADCTHLLEPVVVKSIFDPAKKVFSSFVSFLCCPRGHEEQRGARGNNQFLISPFSTDGD